MSRIFSKTFNCDTTTRNLNKGKSFRFSEWDKTSLFVNDEYIQDFVSYAGSLYACIKSNSNITPPNEQYWKLVISGVEGPQGEVGETGATFTPHVSESGVLSWTNNRDLENPVSVNIKGEKGDPSTVPGPKGDKGEKGDSIVGPKGDKGDQGIGLEFTWNGTKLGIRREGESRYTYVDLKGATGTRGIRGPQGRQGDKGPQGPEGPKGDSLYIQVGPNELGQRFLQKRYSEDEPWVPFFDLSEMRGENGKSIIVERDSSGNVYYRYEGESSSNNKLLIYKDEIKGPKGDTIARTYVGDDGYLYIQLSNEKTPRRAGYVRGDRGADGREIVLRTYTGPSEDPNDPRLGTHIQWKYAGDEYKLWTNLIQINELMNVALMGIKLEYNLEYDTDEDGVETKYDVLEINSYQVEFDEEGKLVLTDKIANISRVAMPTHTQIISIEYDEEKNEIQFILDTATGQQVVAINCDRFIKAGDGITVDHGNIINVNIADNSEILSDDSHILTVDKEGLRIRGVKDKLIKEVNLIKRDRTNDTHYYSYDYVAQDGTIYPIEIPDFVDWENNDDGSRQIFFRNDDKLVSWDSEKVVRDLIRLDETNTIQLGDVETSINLNGKDLNPTYNQQEKLALLSNLEKAITGLHLVKEDVPEESDLAARYSIADKDGNLLGNVHIDVLKDNYLKDVIYNEDTYTFTFDFWVNDDPEEASQVKVVTITLQKLFDNLKALVDQLSEQHKSDVKTLNEAIAKNAENIESLRENLEQETTDRKAADNVLQSNIDTEAQTREEEDAKLQEALDAEIARATEAEQTLDSKLNNEITRAQNAESQIQTDLNNEIARAKAAEELLVTKTDTLNQDLIDIQNNLAAEILRATNAESEIYDHIHEVEANVDGKIDESEKGQPNGVATLDENGFIPSTQINGQMAHVFGVDGVATASTLPVLTNLDIGKIYWTTDTKEFYNWNGLSWDDPMAPKDDTIYNFRNSDATGDTSRTNILYRWDGENLTEISESLALGEVTGTAYEGSKGATNRAAINSLPESLVSTLKISSDTSKVDVNLETAVKSGLNYNEVTSVVKNIPNASKLSAGVITSEEYTSLIETIPNKLTELETELGTKQESGDYVTNEELEAKDYATKSEIPTKVSQLENDSEFITSENLPDLSNYALKSEIPTNVSAFTNDSGYITNSALTDYAKKSEIPDISGLATKTELSGYALVDHTHTASQVSGLARVATTGSYNDLTNKPTIPSIPSISISTSGSGNVVTGISATGHTITVTKGTISSVDTKNTTGTSNSNNKLYLVGGISQSSTGIVTYSNSLVYTQSGQLYASQMNATNGFFEISDARLKDFKENVKALDTVDQIPTKYFTWKSDESKTEHIGTSAQEIQKLYPDLVTENEDRVLSVDYARLSIIALAAIKELKAQIDELKSKIN